MKALILVGGFGTRLRPLTFSKPKPLVEFCNKSMLLHQIEALVATGVNEVVLAVNYRPEDMEAHLKQWESKLNVKISFSLENTPMGTAGPLALAKDLLNDGEPFFVMNSDVTCEYPLKELLEFHKAHGKEGTIMATKVEDPSKYGVILSDADGKIDSFVEKPQVFVGDNINAGIYIFNPAILDRIPLKPTSIEKETFPAMVKDGQLYVKELKGYWADVGQPHDFLTGMSLHLNAVATNDKSRLHSGEGIQGNVLVDPSAKIGQGCLIGPNVVIGPDCVVGDGVRLSDTVLLAGSVVKASARVNKSIVGWKSTVGRWARLDGVTVLGEDVNVKDEVSLNTVKVCPHKGVGASAEKTIIM